MKITCKTEEIVVFDDVLSLKELQSIWHYCQYAPLQQVNTSLQAWTVTDGQPFMGNPIIAAQGLTLDNLTQKALKLEKFAKYPSNSPLDYILKIILEHSDEFTPWLGQAKVDWRCVSATPYIYPQGTALSWHTDSQKGGKTGAYTFYVHPQWKANWGGELLVSEADMSEAIQPRFDRDRDQGLEKDGIFVSPKPNRLVIIKGGTLHKIARVELAAGNNVRASVSGFFYQAKVPQL